ncbi:MAG: glucose-phosphate cytidylyltransferase [Pseudomonadota bacterium]|jgi:glucose-1-phosphate cytidylyltransferase
MKAVILAGGLGTRLSEETSLKPKPLVDVGGKPIIWHIMKIYSLHGVNEFIVCCGYKGYLLKEYFFNYFYHNSDVTVNLESGVATIDFARSEPWKVTLVDTGDETMTGGRLARVRDLVKDDELFCFTYGDGVGNIDISSCIREHKASGCSATVTVAKPPGRFGAVSLIGSRVERFVEKPSGDGGYVNAGFFVLNRSVFKFIDGDETVWEEAPLRQLAEDGMLNAHVHHGFWQPMDTLRDKKYLESLCKNHTAPWLI